MTEAGWGNDPETLAALHAVLTAGRPERLKALTIACAEHDAVLGRVYRTTVGLVLTGIEGGVKRQPTAELAGVGTVTLPPIEGPRVNTWAMRLTAGPSPRWEDFPLEARCGRLYVYPDDLLASIEAGKKRHRVSHQL